MSDDKVSVPKDIVARKMVITPKETEVVKKFYSHFNLEMPDNLKKTMEEFEKNPTIETQKDFEAKKSADRAEDSAEENSTDSE